MSRALWIAIVLFASLSPAWADDITDQINEGLNAYNRKDLATAITGLETALNLMRQMRADAYGALLPDAPPDWTADKVETVAVGLAMAGGGTGATRKYHKGNDVVTISILADSPLMQAMSTLAAAGIAGIGGLQTRIVNGRRTTYMKDEGSFTTIVADRVMVRVEGRGQTEDMLKQFLTAVDFAAVEKVAH